VPKANSIDEKKVIATLNTLLELELAGAVRYLHYSFMVFGHSRIPVCAWLREQATEGVAHATSVGEHITSLGGHPSLAIGPLLETHKHDIDQILKEAAEHEKAGLARYHELLELVRDRSVMLEEFARTMIAEEENHLAEIAKMTRR
jgi:bacterioferritin